MRFLYIKLFCVTCTTLLVLAISQSWLNAQILGDTLQTTASDGRIDDVVPPIIIKGPPAPIPPEVITRDQEGGATLRATLLTVPLEFDGLLNERVYSEVKSVSGLIQTLPDAGQPATEKTEVWVMFDDENIYIGARCWQRNMERTLVANEMRRDRARQNDGFGIALDTFYDRQNGMMFYTTPLGALGDGYVGEAPGATNTSFNPLWDVKTGRFDGGWTVEMVIPFKTLRYRPGVSQVWGMQMRRVIRHRTETAFLTKLPITVGSGGMGKLSYGATLVGVKVPSGSKNIEIKPYGISRLSSDRTITPRIDQDLTADVGLDVKYGLTQSLTADLTVNTDFAQVEVDDQQVNLTRFNLLFPEKREFFLEGTGNFTFGGVSQGTPQIFYSRKIGLNRGRPIPILAGGRVTGKIGRFSIGALNIQANEEQVSLTPKTNFTVIRLKRDLFRRSGIGVIYTGRSESNVAPGQSNHAYGFDSVFKFYDDLEFTGYYAQTETPGLNGKQGSYQATFGFTPDLYGFQIQHLFIGDDFNPEVGFVRRNDIQRTFVSARISPRPTNHPIIRRYVFESSLAYILNTEGILESRDQEFHFQTEFHSSDSFDVTGTRSFDRPLVPFNIAPGVTIPAGDYAFNNLRISYSLGAQKRWTGATSLEYGTYYDGDRTALEFRSGRLSIAPKFSVEPSLLMNWIDLPYGSFTTRLYRSRVNYTFSPRMFVAGLMQYNSRNNTFSTNVRLRWEYILGSELFVVFTEDRPSDNFRGGWSDTLNRAFVVKINRLLRF